jgi:hypothetical protein
MRKKRFGARFIMFPRHWITALRNSRSVNTHHLALTILMETYEGRTKTLTLSGTTVPYLMPDSRRRAARELAELGLIKVEQNGRQALKVTLL